MWAFFAVSATEEPSVLMSKRVALQYEHQEQKFVIIGCGIGAFIVIIIVINVFCIRYWKSKRKVIITAQLQEMNTQELLSQSYC